MQLFDSLLKANTESSGLSGLQYGIVASTDDPLNLQRVQVYDQAKGGQYKSDWLMRGLPFGNFSPPMPAAGELVVFGYIDDNPHKGCYLGLIVNNQNKPVGPDSDLTLLLGGTRIAVKLDGTVVIEAQGKVSITAPEIAFSTQLATIGGKDIATVGAVDSAGHTLVQRGW